MNNVGKYSLLPTLLHNCRSKALPFVALAQSDRGVESQSNKRPGMADILERFDRSPSSIIVPDQWEY
jgi:hypothetical protein